MDKFEIFGEMAQMDEDNFNLHEISPELTCSCDEFHCCQQCEEREAEEKLLTAKIDKVVIKEYAYYQEAYDDLKQQGCKHLGWLNGGIEVPKGEYVQAFSNWSGSSTLYVDLTKRIMYSVDMGD